MELISGKGGDVNRAAESRFAGHYCSEIGSTKVKGQIPFLTGQILNQSKNVMA